MIGSALNLKSCSTVRSFMPNFGLTATDFIATSTSVFHQSPIKRQISQRRFAKYKR